MGKYEKGPNCTVQIKQIKFSEQCNLCKGKLVATDVDLVCSKCGIVVDEKIVDDSRDYENRDGSGGRVGPPTNQMRKINEGGVNMGVIIYAGDDKDFKKGDHIVMYGEISSPPNLDNMTYILHCESFPASVTFPITCEAGS